MPKYWLMKSEPDVFSIDDLKKKGAKGEPWDGIRNYQARNFMRDEMRPGDLAFFYHSNTKVPGIYGLMEVSKEAYPDHTSWDKRSKYFDPKSHPDKPRWFMVDVKFKQKFKAPLSLSDMKEDTKLASMLTLRPGNRLSITPVTKAEFDRCMKLAQG